MSLMKPSAVGCARYFDWSSEAFEVSTEGYTLECVVLYDDFMDLVQYIFELCSMIVSTSAWEICIDDGDFVVRVMGFLSDYNYALISIGERTMQWDISFGHMVATPPDLLGR